jgi:hypothetical protein
MKNQVTLTESEIRLFNMYKNFAIRMGESELEADESALKKVLNSRVIQKEMIKIGFTY